MAKKIYVLFLFIFIDFIANAQEVMIFSTSAQPETKKTLIVKSASISLPFFDDFSSGQINPMLWQTGGVTVSMNSSVLPPSVGAAMFDATDNNGNFYASAYEQSFPSDTLASLPINLNYPGDGTIYLSFFYEPKGYMDMPEARDSLVLQFFSPIDSQWTTVWSDTGSSVVPKNPHFKSVILHITESKYLQDGFRFRFINYTSLGAASYPSLISDCDYWFVDYVYLNRNRFASDTVFADVALQYPPQIRFDNYSAVPASHYLSQKFDLNLMVRFRNNDAVSRTIDSLYIVFNNGQSPVDTLYLGSYSFPPQGNFFVTAQDINYNIPVQQPTDFTLKTKLVTDQFDPSVNNSVYSHLYLNNFYAYDDGSAEAGYGLTGDGTFEALVAARFVTKKTDTLKAIQMYINRTYRDAQPHYFYLMVWENDQNYGIPGELVYQQTGVEIDFDHRDAFQTFVLDTPVVVTDTFYIGWKKTDEQLMNVGLDLNDPVANYKYYNIYGSWEKSSIPGNLMIRPVFGKVATATNVRFLSGKLEIRPNPATTYIYIDVSEAGKLQIYDLYGHQVMDCTVTGGEPLDISSLSAGMYVVRYTSRHKVLTAKLLVVH